MQHESLEPHRDRYWSEHACLEVWTPTSTRLPVVVVRVEGHARDEVVEPLLAGLERAMGRGPLYAFDDWFGVTGYDSSVRTRLTAWTSRNQSRLAETHILLASKVLSMGVSLATRAVGLPVTVYDNRSDFERVVRAHFPAYRPAAKRPT